MIFIFFTMLSPTKNKPIKGVLWFDIYNIK